MQRSWHVPEMTPIIEVFDSGEGDPFDLKPLVSISTYGEMELKKWLMESGVLFPGDSFARYEKERALLVVRNTPENLGLVDGILSAKYPVHTTQLLLRKFLVEIEGKEIPEVVSVVRRYPVQILGPLASVVGELKDLDHQLTFNLEEEFLNKVSDRRTVVLAILPASIEATRKYFEAMVKVMKEGN